MLPTFYQTCLENNLPLADYLLLQILINLLQSIKKVSLESLATALPIPILFESRRKKIQRFLSLPGLSIEKIWFPIVTNWLSTYFEPDKIIYVAIDRTNWGLINLFMVSVIWDQRAFPIYWTLLPKLGSSNIEEQTKILSQVLPLFENYKICILGDREFCSVKLANWLRERNLHFCLRLKKNHFIEVEKDVWLELKQVGLVPGVSLFFQGVRVTKTKGFENFNVACKWQRKISGVTPKEGWFILTSFPTLKEAVAGYKRRFDLEEMFRDFKKGGYNLESTNVTGKRLISLILLIAIAYTSATIEGQEIKRKGVQKYVGRVKETGRLERRHSSFYIGLYSKTWINFIEPCKDLVRQLMKLNRNKYPFYQRGIRAIKLIIEAS